MTSFGIIVIVVVASFCRPTELASCCKSATENVQRAGELSAEDQQQTWRRGVEALDRLHRFWFQRRMLEALHIDDAPVEAPVWRRRRDQQRRSVSSAERNEDGAEQDEGSVRRYTLRIIGVPETHRAQRAHRRRHNQANQRQLGDSECASATAAHYSFYSKIPSSPTTSQQYETQLEKAELELWHPNESLPHLHVRNRPNGDDNEDEPSATASSWLMANRRDIGWSPFRLVQGRQGDEVNGSLFVSDVTDVLRSIWSTTAGANVTISLVRRNDHGAPCIRSVAAQSRHKHTHRRHHEDDESRPPLVLKLSLVERPVQRGPPRKRSIPSGHNVGNTRSNGTSGGRRVHRQMIIDDCETQWDSAFLRETSVGQYDDIMPCCRRRVHIDFNDLGWGSWVVSPTSFDSYYCMGRCTNFGGFATADTDGPAFYTEAMNLYRDARNSGLTPCCSPVKFSPLTITVLTGDNEEMTQTLEDVVVKQCGCM